tara:strand:- start:9870 stop:10217 length:348 start_codon:yes stop_codon:yes gene_type:complete
MIYVILKVALSAILIVAISEVAKRSSVFGALIASLPLTSLLALIWLYLDTGDSQKVGALASDILWLVIPSLLFFIALPVLLKGGLSFWWSLLFASLLTIAGYGLTTWIISRLSKG